MKILILWEVLVVLSSSMQVVHVVIFQNLRPVQLPPDNSSGPAPPITMEGKNAIRQRKLSNQLGGCYNSHMHIALPHFLNQVLITTFCHKNCHLTSYSTFLFLNLILGVAQSSPFPIFKANISLLVRCLTRIVTISFVGTQSGFVESYRSAGLPM